VRAVASPAEAALGADLIVLATSSPTAVLTGRDVRPGTHIAAVGACRPDQREMATDLVANTRLFVDSRAAAMKEAGDILLAIGEGAIAPDHIAGELGELPLGRVTGRTSPGEVTLFKSLGMAIEDVAAAQLVLERATIQGRGQGWDPGS
jgi:ornithine cyclodeaminase